MSEEVKKYFSKEDIFSHPWLTTGISYFFEEGRDLALEIDSGMKRSITRALNIMRNAEIVFMAELIIHTPTSLMRKSGMNTGRIKWLFDPLLAKCGLSYDSDFERFENIRRKKQQHDQTWFAHSQEDLEKLRALLFEASDARFKAGVGPGEVYAVLPKLIESEKNTSVKVSGFMPLNVRERLSFLTTGYAHPTDARERLIISGYPKPHRRALG